ncbi:MAG TPA: COX15/CtaA family protein [Gemmatimonadaceae bacterium]|jgi:heme A synthase
MKSVKRLSIAALVVACLHLIFGAIVRISGSGMGCGENWPKCYGYWIPPFSRPDLIVEVSHRYLASILVITVCSMALATFLNRREPGVSGRGGVLRTAFGAVAAVFSAAILGGVTVKMGNAPWATILHWLNAMLLLALVAMTAIRAGLLGGTGARTQRGTSRAARSAFAAAGLAILAVALGGLTAKFPGASAACTTVPSCGRIPNVETAAVVVQMVHRTAALLLVLHLFGMVMMIRKRRAEEALVVVRAVYVAFGMVLLQLVVASSMILFHLPPVLRSLHEATGVGIWLSCFCLAYLARRVNVGRQAPVVAPTPAAAAPMPVVAPTPAPTPHTMAVIVARGADL